MTKAQQSGLDKLNAVQPFAVVPARQMRSRQSGKMIEITAHIETGVNSKVLESLREAGLIVCSNIWAYGHVSTDLVVKG